MNSKTFENLVNKAQNEDGKSMEILLDMFKPLIYKHSVIDGRLDEDCFQELNIKLIKCVKNFKYN